MIAIFDVLRFHQGQANIDPRAALGCIAYFDGTQVFFDNFFDNGQAEACAAGLGGDIRFENARQQFDRKTGSVVGNGQTGLTADCFGLDQDARLVTAFQRVFGVAQEIVDDLPQLRGIAENGW